MRRIKVSKGIRPVFIYVVVIVTIIGLFWSFRKRNTHIAGSVQSNSVQLRQVEKAAFSEFGPVEKIILEGQILIKGSIFPFQSETEAFWISISGRNIQLEEASFNEGDLFIDKIDDLTRFIAKSSNSLVEIVLSDSVTIEWSDESGTEFALETKGDRKEVIFVEMAKNAPSEQVMFISNPSFTTTSCRVDSFSFENERQDSTGKFVSSIYKGVISNNVDNDIVMEKGEWLSLIPTCINKFKVSYEGKSLITSFDIETNIAHLKGEAYQKNLRPTLLMFYSKTEPYNWVGTVVITLLGVVLSIRDLVSRKKISEPNV